ncbi:MAG: hypothetical protein AAGJ81_05725 [Verrucomicrobiota bacterium]
MANRSDIIAVPRLSGTGGSLANEDLSVIRASLVEAQPQSLVQHWSKTPERGFQRGDACAAWCPEFLHIFARLEDEDIIMAGNLTAGAALVVADIFQFFVQREGVGDYLEWHVTPDNRNQVLSWTPSRFSAFREGGISIDEILLAETSGFSSQAWIDESEAVWSAYLAIPVRLLVPNAAKLREGLELCGSFCRFDSAPDSNSPVISSNSLFPSGPHLHESRHWSHFRLV